MKDEILACIKEEDVKFLQAGQVSKFIFPFDREEAHDKHIPHLIVRVFIVSIDSEGNVNYLVQKRGKNKREFPGFFTDSASGHVLYQEDLDLRAIKQNAYRELEEEFGLKKGEMEELTFHKLKAEKNHETMEIAYMFIGLTKNNVKLNPNEEELDTNGSRFYSEAELIDILKKDNNVDYSREMWEKLLEMDVKTLFNQNGADLVKKGEGNDIGLFIGRFQPLHHGHIYVIKKVLKDHEKIKIGIGSSQLHHEKNNPFTGEERIQFFEASFKVREIPKERYEIYKIPDIFNAEKWVEHVVSIVGDFKILYSNSDWVRGLFKKKGFEVAKKHLIFKNKFDGSHIRELIAIDDKEFRNLVPNEVIQKMKKYNGLERIKELYKEEKEDE